MTNISMVSEVLEQAPIIVFALDNLGKFILSKGSPLQKFGLSNNQIIGQSIFDLYKDIAPQYIEDWDRCLNKDPFFQSRSIITINNEIVVFDTYYKKTYHRRCGDIVIGMAVDITELYLIQQKLEESNKELLESNRILEQFAQIAAHDLRTPIRSIIGFSEKIKYQVESGKRDKVKLKAYVTYLSNAALKMSNIIDDTLHYARIGDVLHKSLFNLLDSVKKANSLIAMKTNKLFKVEMPVPLPNYYGDSNKIDAVFQNLLINSVKFCDKSCCIIQIFWKDLGTHYEICVKDNGPGIPEECLIKIFDLFYSLKPSEDSTGLGLAIVQRVVKKHGGSCWAVSKSDGTEIYFTLKK